MKYGESLFDVLYLLFAIGSGCVMLARAKDKAGKLMGAAATVLSISLYGKDLITSGEYTDTKDITSTPIKDWGYQYKLVPTGSGFTRELIVYDAYGRVYETVPFGSISLGTIFPVVK